MPFASRAIAGQYKHYSYRTEQAYVDWIKRYIYFHDVHHPSQMGTLEVEAFLTHLVVKENVAASTQNQALSAHLFLYREVLHQDLGPVVALPAKRPKRLPTILAKDETLRLIGCLSGTHQLMAKLIYGSGVRLMECLRLRVKDLEFERRALIVRDGKGAQDRVTILPDSLIPLLQEHLQRVKALHEQDLARVIVLSTCPMPWRASTLTPTASGAGNTPSRPALCPRTPIPASRATIYQRHPAKNLTCAEVDEWCRGVAILPNSFCDRPEKICALPKGSTSVICLLLVPPTH
jgi:integrase